MDLLFKRRPSPVQVQVRVEGGITAVPVVMNYVQGGQVRTCRRRALKKAG